MAARHPQMTDCYMAAWSLSPPIMPHSLQLVWSTGTTSSVFSQNLPPPEYQHIQNIHHFSLPFRTREEDDDDESDFDFDDERNIATPPYPSYLIELAEARARQHLEDAERNRDIVAWNSRV